MNSRCNSNICTLSDCIWLRIPTSLSVLSLSLHKFITVLPNVNMHMQGWSRAFMSVKSVLFHSIFRNIAWGSSLLYRKLDTQVSEKNLYKEGKTYHVSHPDVVRSVFRANRLLCVKAKLWTKQNENLCYTSLDDNGYWIMQLLVIYLVSGNGVVCRGHKENKALHCSFWLL